MTAGHPVPVPVTALLDRDGHILSADEPLLRLQIEAGGQADGTLALPALASLVRLALRLRVPLSRAVELARAGTDISLWVQVRPEGDWLRLTIVEWQERSPRPVPSRAATLRSVAGWEGGPGWFWQVDERMRFRKTEAEATIVGHSVPQAAQAFTAYFVLDVDGSDTAMPFIEALAQRADFVDQVAHLQSEPGVRYRISGSPMFDPAGAFTGYCGRAARIEGQAVPSWPLPNADRSTAPLSDYEAQAAELFGPALGRRLDQALRQPLGRIIANAGTISDRVEGPLRQDYVNYATDIAAAGRHLLGLVDDLADLQAIERPEFAPITEEVDLAELARRAAGLLNIRAEARQVRIQTPAADERLFARAEYRRVLQILVNLIGNAVRHSPPESTIWVRIDDEHGRAKVIVADQGGGIDPADHSRVFERFERLGNNDGEGSGLGLYISRKLARAMGGEVVLDSALGRGARFTLDLPAWEARSNGVRAS